jgi:hypothetical protein
MPCSFSLVRHPKVLAKLIDEITSVAGPTEAKRITRVELLNMKYLQNVLKESK